MPYTEDKKGTVLEQLTWAQLASNDVLIISDNSDDGRAKGVLKSEIQDQIDSKQSAGATAGGELSGTYPNPAILNSAVLAKVLTGLNVTGSTLAATDTIVEAFGKVQNQLNGVLGGAIYQGVWNATTNSPSLASATGTKGYYYVVSVAGSTNLDGVTDWKVGDWAIYNGSAWQKVDNTDAVSSVNGYIGAVNLTSADILEVTNLYFTTARVLATALTGFNAAAGTVSASDTILQAINKIVGNIAAINSGITTAVDIQAFTSSGTYTKPTGAKYIKLIMLGAGGGGGSGRRGAAGTLRTGGAGGGSGQVVIVDIPASVVGSTETVTIGAGGAGGNAVTADSTNGNAGTAGGNTTFGSIVRAGGANGGAAGNNSGAAAGGGQVGASSQWSIQGTSGGNSSATGGNGSGGNSQTVNVAPSAGGGGGGITTADAAGTGGSGGNVNISNWFATGYTGINGGAANTAGNVSAALVHYHNLTIGTGGGGGNASIVAAASAGGAGGGPGAGGGGGGASLNGNNSGAGGAGQNGWLVAITYL